MKKVFFAFFLFLASATIGQNKLSINNVYSVNIRNTGAIAEGDQIKGYYIFYQSDKIDRKTNEYTLQILDQNTNATKSVKFTDTKQIQLLDAEFNGTHICFFFLNEDEKQFQYRIYDLNGVQKFTYSKAYDKGDLALFKQQRALMGADEEGPSNTLVAIPNKGFISMLPVRESGSNFVEIGYYSTQKNNEWVYKPNVEERQVQTIYMTSTDSVVYLELNKKKSLMGGQPKSSIMALNFITKKQLFEINDDQLDPAYKFSPLYMKKIEGTNVMGIVANYFAKEDNSFKDFPKGIAFYGMDANGKMVSKVYNQWQGDLSKYLPVNSKGKIDDLGFICIQNIVKAPDGKVYAIAEGYKRNFDGVGTAFKLLGGSGGTTKIVVTDMVLLEFDANYKIIGAKIYPKNHFTGFAGPATDYASQHTIATYLKYSNSFAYEFTSSTLDKSSFSFCYVDYEKTDDYKGGTFNALRYSSGKFVVDKIPTKSKASDLRVLQAKSGFVAIFEYFKKEKRIDFRLEKLG